LSFLSVSKELFKMRFSVALKFGDTGGYIKPEHLYSAVHSFVLVNGAKDGLRMYTVGNDMKRAFYLTDRSNKSILNRDFVLIMPAMDSEHKRQLVFCLENSTIEYGHFEAVPVLDSEINKAVAEPKPKAVAEPKPKAVAELKHNAHKTLVSKTPKDVLMIREYAALHGKTKTKADILDLLARLQNAIVKGEIRRTSPYANEINHIQDELLGLVSLCGKTEQSKVEIEIKDYALKQYREISRKFAVNPETDIVVTYNRLAERKNVKTKARVLKKRAEKLPQTHILEFIEDNINAQIIDNRKMELIKTPLNGIVSSVDFSHEKFVPIQFTGKWGKLIGNPAKPFTMMTYAKPGQGKSTLNLEFAGYLSKTHKKKVLYVSDEERLGYTLQEKIKRLGIANENLFVTGALPSKIDYDFVFIDSVNSMKLEPEDLKQLKEEHPKVSFIYIFQATKDGNFRGGQAYSHDVDVVIEAKNGEASTEKSRFGGNGTVKIF